VCVCVCVCVCARARARMRELACMRTFACCMHVRVRTCATNSPQGMRTLDLLAWWSSLMQAGQGIKAWHAQWEIQARVSPKGRRLPKCGPVGLPLPHLLDQLGASILNGIRQLDGTGNGHTVIDDLGHAKLLLQHHVSACTCRRGRRAGGWALCVHNPLPRVSCRTAMPVLFAFEAYSERDVPCGTVRHAFPCITCLNEGSSIPQLVHLSARLNKPHPHRHKHAKMGTQHARPHTGTRTHAHARPHIYSH